MAYLEIETRDGTHRVQLERDRLSIGRLSYNDVVLPFAQISRQHAELRLMSGRWWIADLHSTNGLIFDERRVQEHCFADGDRITLAPGITLRFMVSDPASSSPRQPAGSDAPEQSAGGRGQRVREPHPAPAARQYPANGGHVAPHGRTWGPESSVPPAFSPTPFVPPSSVAPMRPRSVYSDDEVLYVPPGMQPPQPPPPAYPDLSRQGGPSSRPVSGGYPAPPGPFHAGSDPHDPYMREAPAAERQRRTSGPAPTLLHVCQTCGQLTAPDAVYCQNCHHSIAHECSNCRLSLLPVQDRCPRCHTPNEASVRRAHPGRGEA